MEPPARCRLPGEHGVFLFEPVDQWTGQRVAPTPALPVLADPQPSVLLAGHCPPRLALPDQIRIPGDGSRGRRFSERHRVGESGAYVAQADVCAVQEFQLSGIREDEVLRPGRGETGAPDRVVVLPALDDDLVPVSEKQLSSCARTPDDLTAVGVRDHGDTLRVAPQREPLRGGRQLDIGVKTFEHGQFTHRNPLLLPGDASSWGRR